MKQRVWLLPVFIYCLIPSSGRAQGIYFESGPWDSVVIKAKSQNRLIYLDVYAVWCAPCKALEKSVFPDGRAGDKMNASFISFRADGEAGEGAILKARYGVNAYPTHLFIDPVSGKAVHRYTGGSNSVITFLNQADTALERRSDTLSLAQFKRRLEQGEGADEAFLLAYLRKAKAEKADNTAPLNAWLTLKKNRPVTDAALRWLIDQIQLANNNALPLLLQQQARINAWYPATPDYLGQYLRYWINATALRAAQTKDRSYLQAVTDALAQWNCMDCAATALHYTTYFYTRTGTPAQAWLALKDEMAFYARPDDAAWAAADSASKATISREYRALLTARKKPGDSIELLMALDAANISDRLPSQLAAASLNHNARAVYQNKHAAKNELEAATTWALRAQQLCTGDAASWVQTTDTYARLLYRTGRKAYAIAAESAALAAAIANQLPLAELRKALADMKAGAL